jgi:hypothetical protein
MSGNLPGASNAPIVQIPAIIFCVVGPAVVGIRFWSRIRVSNNLGFDDWTILASLVSCDGRMFPHYDHLKNQVAHYYLVIFPSCIDRHAGM